MSHDYTCPRRSGIGECWCVPTVDRIVDKARLAGQIAEPRSIAAAGGEVVGSRDVDARNEQFDPSPSETQRLQIARLIEGHAALDRQISLLLDIVERQLVGTPRAPVAEVNVPTIVS
jgi:hypothetical protein